jgi:hypothetical protein
VAAWQVENHVLYCAYKIAQNKVLSFAKKAPMRDDIKGIPKLMELYESASKLPGDLETRCNEVRLLHGTKPGALVVCYFIYIISLLPFQNFPTFPSPVPVSIQGTCLRDMTLLIRMCVLD